MEQVERFGVSMPSALLEQFDSATAEAGYANRSEAIRDIVRDYLVAREWQDPEAEVVGTVTIVYDHHARRLDERLTEMQHEHHDAIRCTTHVHLDAQNCIEVIVVSGTAKLVRHLAEGLISVKGVKHGRLVTTTTGRSL